jgi:hypothetical protein
MAKQRQRVDARLAPTPIAPTAAPVNTYSAPGVTQAEQLAQALAQVSPEVGAFSSVLTDKYADEQRAAGEQAARVAAENAKKAGDLTREGALPAQDNPWFMASFKEEQGRLAAGDWASQFKLDSSQDPTLQESLNLQDFDKAASQHLEKWMKDRGVDRDGFYEKGFGHMKDQYLLQQRFNFGEQIEKRIDKKSDEASFAMAKRAITDNIHTDGMTLDPIADTIEALVAQQVARGRPEAKVRAQVSLAIAAAAKELGPETGLNVLGLYSMVKGEGGAGSLKDQTYGAQVLEQTENDLTVERNNQIQTDRQRRAQEKQDRVDKASEDGLAYIMQHGSQANMARWARENGVSDPEVLQRLQSIQVDMDSLEFRTNKNVYDSLQNRIFDPKEGETVPTAAEITDWVRKRGITAPDAQGLISLLNQAKDRASRGEDRLDPRAKPYFDLQYHYAERAFQDITGVAYGERGQRVANSQALLWKSYWALKNSGQMDGMTEDQLNQYFATQMAGIVSGQVSESQLEFDPPTQPVISPTMPPGVPGSAGVTGSPSGGAKQAFEMPKELIVPESILRASIAGDQTKVWQFCNEKHIPPEQRVAFVNAQKQLFLKKAKP